MELPKNITQIGEVGRDCKVYAEDYVISYLKQLNRSAQDKTVAVALYGRRREEEGIAYFFLYGACRLTLLDREVRHLSQAQYQEIERLRRRHFPEYLFLGYRLLDGEMIEGFHICEQEICRYIAGYAQFYEKNDPMLSYMLEERKEIPPEQVDQEKYEEVKKRQEERRQLAEGQARGRVSMPKNVQKMQIAAAGAFAALCLIGFVVLSRGGEKDAESLRASAKQWVSGVMMEQPGSDDAVATSGSAAGKDVLVMEDKLEQALLQENQAAGALPGVQQAEQQIGQQAGQAEADGEPQQAEQQTGQPAGQQETDGGLQPTEQQAGQPAGQSETDGGLQEPEQQVGQSEADEEPQSTEQQAGQPEAQESDAADKQSDAVEAVAYVIRNGDTLTAISRRQYGSDVRVADICTVNKIVNPDDIKVGQVIMLPK